MKKIVLSLTVISLLFFTSCKDDKKATENQEISTSENQENPATGEEASNDEANKNSSTGVPRFNNVEVQKYVDEYGAYVKDYLEAAKAKDIAKLGELGTKAQGWITKGQAIAKKLADSNPDEFKKFNDYIQKLSQEMTAALTQQ